jgi:hypothetical protein
MPCNPTPLDMVTCTAPTWNGYRLLRPQRRYFGVRLLLVVRGETPQNKTS